MQKGSLEKKQLITISLEIYTLAFFNANVIAVRCILDEAKYDKNNKKNHAGVVQNCSSC